MASFRIKSASVYLGGRKIGQIENIDYSINPGDEPQFGDGGFLGYSDGATTTTLTCSGVIPLTGLDVDIVAGMLNKQDFEVVLAPVGNKVHQVTMRNTGADIKGNQRTGVLTGEFKFGGGPPKVIG